MRADDRNSLKNELPDFFTMKKHDGHSIRTRNRKIVDRSVLHEIKKDTMVKQPNQYTGHTYLNKKKRFRLDGHKMLYHLERVLEWQKGERIAPVHIDMGLTKFCNIGCIYCIGVTQGGMKKGEMITPDALLSFIKDAGRLGVKSIGFIGDGEPTLNPALYDAILLAAESNVDTAMATNGVLLNMDRIDDVLSNQTYLRFNLSAGTPESYRKIHQTSIKNFDILKGKISESVKIRNENSYKCTIGLQMVLIPENFDQVIPLTEFAAKSGVDYLQIKQCSDTEYHELGIDRKDYENAQAVLKEAETYSNDTFDVQVKWNKINILDDTEVYKGGYRKYDICYGTPFLGQISGNGKVYPCGPFFAKDRFLMGDLHKDSYYDIVKSDRYWEVHKDIVENVDVHCDCTVGCRQDYINKFLWDIMNPPEHVNFI